jgi:NADH:ubiquinone oxidoreductase subunit 6 (subunit J)
MLSLALAVVAISCAIQAIRATRLLTAALWLAAVSASIAILLYTFGAREVAVIELSVGAGLVTVLFVFAISIAGDDAMSARAIVPTPLAAILALLAVSLLSIFVLPTDAVASQHSEPAFAVALWQQRGLDILVQIVLIFAGVIGVLGLLSEQKNTMRSQIAEGRAALLRSFRSGQIPGSSMADQKSAVEEEMHV